MKKAFAENLKRARAFKGWTQESTAQKIGIKRPRYQAYEEGRACPTAYNLIELARVFGVDDLKGFLINPDFDINQLRVPETVQVEKVLDLVQEKYRDAPIKDKLAINILLGLVDLE